MQQKVKVKRKLPDWFKVKFPAGENFHELKEKFSKASLNTVCEEAACPNIADCWDRKTATFMILGDTCTRACSYCNVNILGLPTCLIKKFLIELGFINKITFSECLKV